MSAAYRVDRVDNLSPADFAKNYVEPRQPVLFSGGLKDCAASSEWSFDYLRARAGKREVVLKE